MFKSAPQPVLPAVPAQPPNPPMFGSEAPKKRGGGAAPQQFNASVLGTVPGPGGTGQKTLLGA